LVKSGVKGGGGGQYRVIGGHDSIRTTWLSSTWCMLCCISDMQERQIAGSSHCLLSTLRYALDWHHSAAQNIHTHKNTKHTHTHTHTHTYTHKGQLCVSSLPELMTHTMSSMVTAVSAILVARMSLRTPGGGRMKTLRWSWVGTMECRGSS